MAATVVEPVTRVPDQPSVDPRATLTLDLLRAAADTDDPAERRELLDRVVTLNMPVARSAARHYYDRGVSSEDLDQVAYLSLVAAAQRFSPDKGSSFLAYAIPTIRGELRRHFRDRGWMVRPPRRLQDSQREVSRGISDLTQTLGRSPTTREVAVHLGISEDEVIESLATQSCYRPTSLDSEVQRDGEHNALIDILAAEETSEVDPETLLVLKQLIGSLPERDRRILGMRFYEDLTQQEIAREVGLSQMQVSRILSRVLGQLRDRFAEQSLHEAS